MSIFKIIFFFIFYFFVFVFCQRTSAMSRYKKVTEIERVRANQIITQLEKSIQIKNQNLMRKTSIYANSNIITDILFRQWCQLFHYSIRNVTIFLQEVHQSAPEVLISAAVCASELNCFSFKLWLFKELSTTCKLLIVYTFSLKNPSSKWLNCPFKGTNVISVNL